MKSGCSSDDYELWKEYRQNQRHPPDILDDINALQDISAALQRKQELTRRLTALRRFEDSLHQHNSQCAEVLYVDHAEHRSLQTLIASVESELEEYRQAKEDAEVVTRCYQPELERADLALQQQREENVRHRAKAEARVKAEEERVYLLQLEVEQNSHKLKECKDECKKMTQQLERQGLLTRELREQLACITSFPMEQLRSREECTRYQPCARDGPGMMTCSNLTRGSLDFRGMGWKVDDSSSEMDASDEADLGSRCLEKPLAADEHKSPETSLERCFAALAEMKVPRAPSPFPPSLLLAGLPPSSLTTLVPVQLAPSLLALPAGKPLPSASDPVQLTCPSEPAQSIPVLDPVVPKQGPEHELCKSGQSTTEQDPSTLEPSKPKEKLFACSPTQYVQDEQLSDSEAPPPNKKPRLSKRQKRELFSSSSGEEDEVTEERNIEQSPLSAFPFRPAECAAATSRVVSTNLGGEGTHNAPQCGPLHVSRLLTLPKCQDVGMKCSPASATTIKAALENLRNEGMPGTHKGVACSPLHTVSNKALSGDLAQARESQNVGIVHSPAPAIVSKVTSASSSEGVHCVSVYSAFLRSKKHAATCQAAVSKGQTSKAAQLVLGRLAFLATQAEDHSKKLEDCVRNVECEQLVRGALNYLCKCMANPMSAYCRGEQTSPLITKFEDLLLQALAYKQDGWVMLLSALRARFSSCSRPCTLLGRASYVRLIGALCCKLSEPTVAHVLIWDLLGTNQAPFLVASVVGAWPGLLKALPLGVVQKTVAYLLYDSTAHTLNSTLEFQSRQVLRTLGPLRGFIKYIPKQIAKDLLDPLLSAHKCGDICVMHHRSLQELCQRLPETLLPWLLEQQLAPQAESLVDNHSTGCLIFLLVSLWKMYKEPPKALEPMFTKLLQRARSMGSLAKKRFFMEWEGTREVLRRSISNTQQASRAEPPHQKNA